MIANQREFMPEAGKILNRVHLEIKEGFVKHSYELDGKVSLSPISNYPL